MKTWFMKKFFKFRYGVVTACIAGVEAGHISEVAYKDLKGRLLGYWAFGSFDPSYPINENNFKYITTIMI